MTPQEFQDWLDNNPDLQQIPGLFATMTALVSTQPSATEPPAPATLSDIRFQHQRAALISSVQVQTPIWIQLDRSRSHGMQDPTRVKYEADHSLSERSQRILLY